MIEKIKSVAKNLDEDDLIMNFNQALNILRKAKNENVNGFITFNGEKLYSLFDSEDDCYIKVYGRTKVEYDEHMKNIAKSVENERTELKEEFDRKAPEIIEKGKKIIAYPERQKEWEDSIKHDRTGFDMGFYIYIDKYENALSVMERLNNGEDPKVIFDAIPENEKERLFVFLAIYHRGGIELLRKYRPEMEKDWEKLKQIEEQNNLYESNLNGNQPGEE